MIDLQDFFGKKTVFVIQNDEWTDEDTDDLKTLISFPKFEALVKLVHRRINSRTEDLVNGKEVGARDRIDELKDLLLELNQYGDS